jgi:hypothetical protein
MAKAMSPRLPVSVAALLLFGMPAAALADRIDGNWCFPDGRHFSIRGPEIVTPAGSSTTGDYSRHHFSYVVPSADPDPGQAVEMRLMSEDTLFLWLGGEAAAAVAPPQVWHRCPPEVSDLIIPRAGG